jgi:hypothetical protein
MSLIGDLKEVGGILQKAGNIDLFNKLIEIQGKAIEVMDRDLELKEENLRLKNELATSKVLEFRDDVYWIKSDTPGEKGPYCSKCYDVNKKLVHFIRSDSDYHKCPSCDLRIRHVWR